MESVAMQGRWGILANFPGIPILDLTGDDNIYAAVSRWERGAPAKRQPWERGSKAFNGLC